jgi:ergothioneine biosynthesis protein EgtB
MASVLADRLARVRAHTVALAAPLTEADAQVQSMPDASPAKWHLAHVTWFFETMVLERFEPGFQPHHPAFRVLFNSYYQGVGDQHPRPQRGLITRPGLAEVLAYRSAVDARLQALLDAPPGRLPAEALALVELGLQHEQQHQELLLTDVLHLLSCNPLSPAYDAEPPAATETAAPLSWLAFDGGLVDIGHSGGGFAFDNESPRHRAWLAPHALAQRLSTQGEWLAFVADGGYRDPRWWLSAAWEWLRAERIEAPLHWRRSEADGPPQAWQTYTLNGLVALDPHRPVVHISLYEADAYARWLAAQTGQPLRLPTEAEWERAAAAGLPQAFGHAWQWTNSAYLPYPGFQPWAGAVGEYNGKFMMNQMVLRGGSLATPYGHSRISYRNFFPPSTRWQFSGLRLARDGG